MELPLSWEKECVLHPDVFELRGTDTSLQVRASMVRTPCRGSVFKLPKHDPDRTLSDLSGLFTVPMLIFDPASPESAKFVNNPIPAWVPSKACSRSPWCLGSRAYEPTVAFSLLTSFRSTWCHSSSWKNQGLNQFIAAERSGVKVVEAHTLRLWDQGLAGHGR